MPGGAFPSRRPVAPAAFIDDPSRPGPLSFMRAGGQIRFSYTTYTLLTLLSIASAMAFMP